MEVDFEPLIKLVRKQEVSLFIGAGFSLKAGAPSCGKIVEVLKENLKEEDCQLNGDQLDYVADEFQKCYGRDELIKCIKPYFDFEPADISDHKKLAQIPHFQTIFTTNYDTLLEQVYSSDKCDVIVEEKDCITTTKPVRIYKIHGDFSVPNRMILTKTDYFEYFNQNKNQPIWNVVKSDFLNKHILFIGYSLNDYNIERVIQDLRNYVGGDGKEMFLIAPNFKSREVERLKRLNVTYYDCEADRFLDALLNSLKENIVDDYRKKWVEECVYTEFLSRNGVGSVIKPGEKKNEVLQLTSVDGTPLKQSFHFTYNGDKKKLFEFEDNDDGKIPINTIYSKEISDFSFNVNGLRFLGMERLACISIKPEEKDLNVSIGVLSDSFILKTKCKSYLLSQNQILFDFYECPILMFRMTVKKLDTEDLFSKGTFHFELKKNYTNNDDAIKWVKFFILLCERKEMHLKGDLDFAFVANCDDKMLKALKKCRLYYENIKRIEEISCECFPNYEQFSDENYRFSEIVLNSLIGKTIKRKNSIKEIPFKAIKDDEQLKRLNELYNKNTFFPVYLVKKMDDFKFNGLTYSLFMKRRFENCLLMKRNELNNNKCLYYLAINGKETIIQWCNGASVDYNNEGIWIVSN